MGKMQIIAQEESGLKSKIDRIIQKNTRLIIKFIAFLFLIILIFALIFYRNIFCSKINISSKNNLNPKKSLKVKTAKFIKEHKLNILSESDINYHQYRLEWESNFHI